MSDRRNGCRFSWSLLALAAVCALGITLTLTLKSVQAQNAVQILSGSTLAGIIVHRLHKASDVVDAALRLAGEMAGVRRDAADADRRLHLEDGESTATVVVLPSPRPTAKERSEVP